MPDSEQERQRKKALIGLLSGDPQIGAMSEAMLRTAGRSQNKLNLGNGFIYDPETGQTAQDPAYANFVAERERAAADRAAAAEAGRDSRLQAQIAAQNDRFERGLAAREGAVPFSQRVQAAEANRLAQEAADLFGEMQRTRGSVSSAKDIAASAAGAVPVVGTGVARVAEEQMFTPEQRAVKSRGRRFEQNLSNLASGMALTGFEFEQREKWSPFASGITEQEALTRLRNIERDFGARRDAILTAGGLQPGGENTRAPAPPESQRKRLGNTSPRKASDQCTRPTSAGFQRCGSSSSRRCSGVIGSRSSTSRRYA